MQKSNKQRWQNNAYLKKCRKIILQKISTTIYPEYMEKKCTSRL